MYIYIYIYIYICTYIYGVICYQCIIDLTKIFNQTNCPDH